MLVASVDRGGPHLAEDDVPGFGIPVFRDGVFRVADLHTVTEVAGMRRPVEGFITAQSVSPPVE